MEGKGVLGRTLPVSLLGAALPASKADLKVILSILGEGEQAYEYEQEGESRSTSMIRRERVEST